MLRKGLGVSLVLAAILTGCGRASLPSTATSANGAGSAALAAQAAANGIPEADQPALQAALDEISSEFMEDGEVRMMAPPVTPSEAQVKGGFWYKSFVNSGILRGIGYTMAAWPVKRHFSKPSKKDTIAPVRGAELEALKATLQPGDVIQCGNDGSFVHAIMYLGDDKIVHALAQAGFGKSSIGVRAETLTEYFNRTERDKVVVLRPKWTPEQLGIAHDYAMSQVGKKYDTLFLTDSDDRHYCTELVYQCLTRAGVAKIQPKLAKFKWRLVTNEEIRKSADLQLVSRRNAD